MVMLILAMWCSQNCWKMEVTVTQKKEMSAVQTKQATSKTVPKSMSKTQQSYPNSVHATSAKYASESFTNFTTNSVLLALP
mmetsp:Transcript_17971/g.36714  ORF Transcript_17971/g.36714 Transcript_17971/m.36714 type:complete len:81 (+) Transcript_17971:630-872(+)